MILHRRHFWIYLAGIAFVCALGVWPHTTSQQFGNPFTWWSYNIPFIFQNFSDPRVVLITIDPDAKRNLQQPSDVPLDRSFYTQLIKRLHADGAKLILFDLISFDEPHPNPNVDREFIAAALDHGGVVLVTHSIHGEQGNLGQETLVPIAPEFRDSVAAWGLAHADADHDGVVRRIYPGTFEIPTSAWEAARLLGAEVTKKDSGRIRQRWLNYYGPPGSFRRVYIDHALNRDEFREGTFRDKIVFVGFGSDIGPAGAPQDTFPSPYSKLFPDMRLSFGVEIVALSTMNLVRGNWLNRSLTPPAEITLALLWGCISVLLFSSVKPATAGLLSATSMLAFFGAGVVSQIHFHNWWTWAVPVAQTPVALVWGIGYKYLIESRRRRQMDRAMSAYLSPHMVEKIAASEFSLTPGGVEVEATIMFTDLEGFTKLSETLSPVEVSNILIAYFEKTTTSIREQDGTTIKYIGDAVLAVWGAPLPDPRQAERAVLAAWQMSQASKEKIEGRLLKTRIGVNTGIVLAGNLGSRYRIDYTVIGDAVNFASRLEGLNKYLGTDILISETTRSKLSDALKVRALGRFRVVGKKLSVGIFEVMGLAESFDDKQEWVARFEQALQRFGQRQFDEAELLFKQTIAARNGADGPSEFYLAQIPKVRATAAVDWDGSVLIEGK